MFKLVFMNKTQLYASWSSFIMIFENVALKHENSHLGSIMYEVYLLTSTVDVFLHNKEF